MVGARWSPPCKDVSPEVEELQPLQSTTKQRDRAIRTNPQPSIITNHVTAFCFAVSTHIRCNVTWTKCHALYVPNYLLREVYNSALLEQKEIPPLFMLTSHARCLGEVARSNWNLISIYLNSLFAISKPSRFYLHARTNTITLELFPLTRPNFCRGDRIHFFA